MTVGSESDARATEVSAREERRTLVRGGGRHRLLFLCQVLPHPADIGVSIRTYNVMRLLAREFKVTALCFYRAAMHSTRERVATSEQALSGIARMSVFPIPQEHSRLRFSWDHARSVLTRRPYTIFAYRSVEFRDRLRALLDAERFDLVHMDSLDLADHIPELTGAPVVCVHHNVESALLRSRAATSGQPARAYLKFQSRLTEREERRFCPGFAMNVAVSSDDAATLRRIAPGSRVEVVPNGVDTAHFRPGDDGTVDGLVFVGGHSWQPNREAMAYFCAEILPLLRAEGLHPRVTWVGHASDDAKRDYEQEFGVHLTGYVDDIRSWVAKAACYIVPLRAGGGTRLKILDAWAMGKPVVSTSVGCAGLQTRDGDNILVRDTPESFADAIAAVLRDGALRRRLAMGARRTAEELYDWEVIGRKMLSLYAGLLAD